MPASDPQRRFADGSFVALTIVSFSLLVVGLSGELLAAGLGMVVGATAELIQPYRSSRLERLDRIVGLTHRQRLASRMLLMVAGIAVATGGNRGLVASSAVFSVTIIGGYAITATALRRSTVPPVASIIRNLDIGLPFATAIERRERLRISISTAWSLFTALIFVAMAFLAEATPDAAAAVATTGTVLTAASSIIAIAVTWRLNTAPKRLAHLDDFHAAVESYDPEVLIYVVAAPSEFYFVEQWLESFDQIERRCLFVTRQRGIADRIMGTTWPVVFAPDTRSVEASIGPSTRLALYLANTGRNVHLVRQPGLTHIFLNHGDSDKATSANPVARMYDEVWVAGQAAAERYKDAGVVLSPGAVRFIGRPQTDGLIVGPLESTADRAGTVLYAPTFEGQYGDMNYSSVDPMGPGMIEVIVNERPDLAIIFRPHPSTGKQLSAVAQAADRITTILASAHNAPLHRVVRPGTGRSLIDDMNDADILITDVSAVATDFMATNRPLMVTNPRDLTLDEYRIRFPNLGSSYVVGQDLSEFADLLNVALNLDPLRDERIAATRHLLGSHPNGPVRTFVETVNRAYDESAPDASTSVFRVF